MKKCYECEKEMTTEEVVKGINMFYEYQEKGIESDKYIHCAGTDEQFVLSTDTEIINAFNPDDFDVVSHIVICEECVKGEFMEGVK